MAASVFAKQMRNAKKRFDRAHTRILKELMGQVGEVMGGETDFPELAKKDPVHAEWIAITMAQGGGLKDVKQEGQ